MKFSIAVLSSVLVACSVTTANPTLPSSTIDAEFSTSTVIPSETTNAESSTLTAIPSATTSTESSPLSIPNVNGIGLHGLTSLPDKIKDLLKKYTKLKQDCPKQKKVCDLIESQFFEHKKLVKKLENKVTDLKLELENEDSSHDHSSEMEKYMLDLEGQYFLYLDFEKKDEKCKAESTRLEGQLKVIKIQLVKLVFGGPCNVGLLEKQFLLILSHSTVGGYLETLCEGQSSGCKKGFGQTASTQRKQRKRRESQLSPETLYGSGSTKQRDFSKSMDKLGSLAELSEDDESSD
ncbi:hypothetical protein O5D80_003191 [Batrachochytrium dendrobatidis]|nr:hypothetical protein O5D80_007278 [Batrachochytrium dendrobatidis]KAJ8328610.1 hypothetical protein O5D80_003191 [Batrachochytrium dendrobatidis]